ncbi:MAG: (d)CMP kinase [bacterium]|nr:(d)CMP kinase [bacterium]
MKSTVIAIDGPAGAGKTTLAKLLAERLGLLYIDTGAMYRSLTWKILQLGINFNNKDLVIDLSRKVDIILRPNGKDLKIFINGDEVTDLIRTPEVTENTFYVAQIKEVREEMVKKQRSFVKENRVIMEGRDIGTVVFPEADKKIYLDAQLSERVNRRFKEFKAKGFEYTTSKIEQELAERDKKDKTRLYGPLKIADDAVYLDTTNLNIPEMVEEALRVINS